MKQVFITIGAVIALSCLVAGLTLIRHLRRDAVALEKAQKVPAEFALGHVLTGQGSFSSKEWVKMSSLGSVTDIEPSGNHDFTIAGRDGAAIVASSGISLKTLSFGTRCDGGVRVANIGRGAFLCESGWRTGTSLMDQDGKTLWSYKGESAGIVPDGAVAGEFGPNHVQGVVVGMNGDGGVRMFNADGKQMWVQPDGNIWHIELVPANDAGNVIVHSNGGGQLTQRDASGKVLKQLAIPGYFDYFSPTAWGNDPKRSDLIAAKQGKFQIFSINGELLTELPAPAAATDKDLANGIPLHMGNGAIYYAATVDYPLWHRSLLYIYNQQNQVAYSEVISQDCKGMSAITQKDDVEDLLLGCDNVVLRYTHLSK